MAIIATNTEPEPLSQYFIEKIEHLILSALIDNKDAWRRRAEKLTNDSQAEKMVTELEELQPQIGYHVEPKSAGDAKIAVRHAIEKDDFYTDRPKRNTDLNSD